MRDLQGIDPSAIAANRVSFAWFVKIEIPTGDFYRLTDRHSDYTGNIEGSSQDWIAYDVRVGSLVQNQQSPMDVSYIDLQNLDNAWSTLALTEGFRYRPVQIWQAWFDIDDDSLLGSMLMFDGRTDEGEFSSRAKISLVPHRTPWVNIVPARRYLSTCQYLFKNTDTCQYAGGDTTCTRTITDCTAKGNQAHFGGFHLMPKSTDKTQFGNTDTALPPAPLPVAPPAPLTPPGPGPGPDPGPTGPPTGPPDTRIVPGR